MARDLLVHDAPDDTQEGGEEIQFGEVPRPVLPLGCSLTQFASFQNAWNQFYEQHKSWHRDESQHVVNYELNYKLLASIPETLEDKIYRDLRYKVETISTMNLLNQIKRVVVTRAVEHAQRAEVEKMPVKEVGKYAMGEDEEEEVTKVAVEDANKESDKGGLKGGIIQEIPRPIVQKSEVERAEIKEVAQFVKGDSKEESEGEGGQEGGAIEIANAEKIPKSVLSREGLNQNIKHGQLLMEKLRDHKMRKKKHQQSHLCGKQSPSSPTRSSHPSSPASPSETSGISGPSGTSGTLSECSPSHDDQSNSVNPGPIAANTGKTSLAGLVGGIRSHPPELAGEDSKGEDNEGAESRTAIRQPNGSRGGQEGGTDEIPKSALLKQETEHKTDEGITVKHRGFKKPTVGNFDSNTRKKGNLKSIQKEKLKTSLENKSEKSRVGSLKKKKLKKKKQNVKNEESLQLHNKRKLNSSLEIFPPKDITQTDDEVLIEDKTKVEHPADKPPKHCIPQAQAQASVPGRQSLQDLLQDVTRPATGFKGLLQDIPRPAEIFITFSLFSSLVLLFLPPLLKIQKGMS